MIKSSFIDNNNHNKRLFSKLLMIIVIIITMNNVWMANGGFSIILHGNNQTEWDTVRYPYKSVYGLPNSLNCSEWIRKRFNECEKLSHHNWQITIDDYFYETKKFCCFIWETLDCELDVATECNEQYSTKLESNTRDTFKKVCDQIVGSNYGSDCWWTEERQIIFGILAGILILAFILIFAIVGCQIHQHTKLDESPNYPKAKKITDPKKLQKLKEFLYPESIGNIQKPVELSAVNLQSPKTITVQNIGQARDYRIFNEIKKMDFPIQPEMLDDFLPIPNVNVPLIIITPPTPPPSPPPSPSSTIQLPVIDQANVAKNISEMILTTNIQNTKLL
ncbi:uncharacterized protein LOC113791381 [Dermatophagoides pteronyssinus]|uniref:uncharacterized protein LOC113791381 n=1 Tax=Dermatophagoides pteronyssinus TaxID=6956 RepID=UPI003F67F5CD